MRAIARSAEGSMAATHGQRSFSTKWSDLRACRGWLVGAGCVDVRVESTGKCWVPVANALEGSRGVVVSSPRHARPVRGKKSGSKDATWMADLFRLGLVVPSHVPARDIRDAREISRRRHELACTRASERNRHFRNCPAVPDATLAGVPADCFGKTARAVTGRVVAGGDPPDE